MRSFINRIELGFTPWNFHKCVLGNHLIQEPGFYSLVSEGVHGLGPEVIDQQSSIPDIKIIYMVA